MEKKAEPGVPGAEQDRTPLLGSGVLSTRRRLAIPKSRISAGKARADQSRGGGGSQAEP